MTEWKPTTRDLHKLMREPSKINDSNAVAILMGKSGENETQQADDVHPNNVTDRFKIIGLVPALMAIKQVSKGAYKLRKSNNQGKRVNRGGGYVIEFPCEIIYL